MMQQRDDERGNEQSTASLSLNPNLPLSLIQLRRASSSCSRHDHPSNCMSCSFHSLLCDGMDQDLDSRYQQEERERERERENEDHQRNEKISNKSSFGIIDIAESSTTDRIIVIVDTACLIHDGAYR